MSVAFFHNDRNPREMIVLPDNVYHSYRGEYFFGQTETLRFDHGHYAWGGLVNPADSRVMMFLNAYTISNFSAIPITAEGWLSSELQGDVVVSSNYATGNQAIVPARQPWVTIESASYVTEKPSGGTYTFVRRVEPSQTLTKHDFQGMYIIPPGSSFILFFLPAEGAESVDVRIACGWWEERL